MVKQISAVIICHNEEENLPRCLASLAGLADEIVVVDSFSDDQTPAICREAGVRFFQREWTGYSDAKNFGNQQAAFPFIFSIDADEVVSETLKASLLAVKENPNARVYSMNRLTNYCGKWIRHGGWYPDRKVRLWERDIVKWEGSVHEIPVMAENVFIQHIPGDLLHYSIPSREVHRQQIEKYSSIWAKDAFSKGRKSYLPNLIFKPVSRFISTYLLKRGFLDGKEGFRIALMSAFAVYLRHTKLRKLYHTNGKDI